MDALAGMFRLAEQLGVLESLRLAGIKHRISLYADDLVVFARPESRDLQAVHAILRCFGGASGLHVNLAKSAAAPIRCSSAMVDNIAPDIACPLMQFPCVYLGLPLSIGRLRKGDLELVLDKLAAKLPHWKARLLTKEGRVTYVHAIMTASVVYQLLALDMEPWFLQAVDKLRRDFFWAGDRDSSAGRCLVDWDLVCRPKHLGGMGFHNLAMLNSALRAKWIWLKKTDHHRSWAGLDLTSAPAAINLFNTSVTICVGDGASVLFWLDPWIGGLNAAAIAPALLAMVKPRFQKRRTV
jgi:hypothetical protein